MPMDELPTSIPICHNATGERCDYGNSCKFHHYPMPYLWCIQIAGKWIPLKEVSPEIEFKYAIPENANFVMKILDPVIDMVNFVFENMHPSMMVCPAILLSTGEKVLACRLSTISYVKDDQDNNFSTVWQWYWKDDTDWKPYGLKASQPHADVIEARFQSGTKQLLFETGKFEYKLFIQGGYQINIKTRTKRDVLRRPLYVSEEDVLSRKYPERPERAYTSLHLPIGFAPMDTKSRGYELVPLDTEDSDYKEVYSNFHKTMSDREYTIKEIYQVQNIQMWKNFKSAEEEMERKHGTKETPLKLFHGTDNKDVVTGICYQNFDPRMSGKNATMYGQGAYFARDAQYSNRYTSRSNEKYMFLAHVLVGKYTKGDTSMKRPPNFPGQKHELYDSTVNDELNPTIFVVYDSNQCYPMHLILYRTSAIHSMFN